jgi:DNA adenine methylase
MDPIYKWTGGKRKDIKHFEKYLPIFTKNGEDYMYVEPFFGAGALYWYLNNKTNIINDIDYDLINFLNILKSDEEKNLTIMINQMEEKISEITKLEKNGDIDFREAKTERGYFYYLWRDKDRSKGLENLSNLERAFRFYFVNQWAFNGMRRFNSRGEFNIPYGNYKQIKVQHTKEHLDLLKNTEINCGDYKEIILKNDVEKTFIFLDPPYTREFKEYSHENSFGEEQQIELFEVFQKCKKSSVMLIINKDDFTEQLYKNYIKDEYDFKYSTNIKNRYSNEVKHLIITNY